MKLLSRYVEALRLGAQIDVKAPPGGVLAGSSVLVTAFQEVSTPLITATSTSFTVYTNDNVTGTFKLVGATVVFGTASSSGTLQVEIATGTQAVGAGTNQLTAAVSLAGAANTPINGTVIAAPTILVAGTRINVILGGTLTSLANCNLQLVLQRLT